MERSGTNALGVRRPVSAAALPSCRAGPACPAGKHAYRAAGRMGPALQSGCGKAPVGADDSVRPVTALSRTARGRFFFYLNDGISAGVNAPASSGNHAAARSGSAISASFSPWVSFALMAYSSRAAALLSPQRHSAATASGGWARVYLAPRPLTWSAHRRGRSLVSPVYRLPSRHRRIYT